MSTLKNKADFINNRQEIVIMDNKQQKLKQNLFQIYDLFLEKIISFYVCFLYKPICNLLQHFFLAHPLSSWVTPNRVTIARTLLVIPTIICLLTQHFFIAAFLVLFNDFLDAIDGVICRVHASLNIIYDQRFGAFLDAVCDKAFNGLVWYSWLMIDIIHHGFVLQQLILVALIFIEASLFWKRVELYYSNVADVALKASYSGKAKQTFETLGTALLFVVPNIGYCILFFSVFLACKSYFEKKRSQVQ